MQYHWLPLTVFKLVSLLKAKGSTGSQAIREPKMAVSHRGSPNTTFDVTTTNRGTNRKLSHHLAARLPCKFFTFVTLSWTLDTSLVTLYVQVELNVRKSTTSSCLAAIIFNYRTSTK